MQTTTNGAATRRVRTPAPTRPKLLIPNADDIAQTMGAVTRPVVAANEQPLDEAFPAVDPGATPLGSGVLVQLRSPRTKTRGGILLSDDARDTEKWNTQVAKVIACGRLAFHNRTTGEPWPEGSWVKPGEFVRIPKYGGDRWAVPTSSGNDALFVIFNDLTLIAKVTADPRTMKAFI